jgi:hypothetical protein
VQFEKNAMVELGRHVVQVIFMDKIVAEAFEPCRFTRAVTRSEIPAPRSIYRVCSASAPAPKTGTVASGAVAWYAGAVKESRSHRDNFRVTSCTVYCRNSSRHTSSNGVLCDRPET